MNERNHNYQEDITVTELPQEGGGPTDGIRLTPDEYDTLMKKVELPNRFERGAT
jgi:hypothetical protein